MAKEVVVSQLNVDYIKSCAPTQLDTLRITDSGPYLDRHWMLTDPHGNFITQRDFATLALVNPKLTEEGLVITSAAQTSELVVPLSYSSPQTISEATIWSNKCLVEDDGDVAARWFSSLLNTECRLVHMAPGVNRNKEGSNYGFADSWPLTIQSDESVADLNARIEAKGGIAIAVDQFKTNIHVQGCEPYAEDIWGEIAIGMVGIKVVKPVVRCKIPQINQHTAVLGKEPAATLAKYRMRIVTGEAGRKSNEILFAQKARQLTTGEIHVGDVVRIHTTKDAPVFR